LPYGWLKLNLGGGGGGFHTVGHGQHRHQWVNITVHHFPYLYSQTKKKRVRGIKENLENQEVPLKRFL